MRSLARSIRRPDRGGEPLPTVYRTFERAGIFIRRGEVTMLAAPPGAGKSALGLDIARRIQRPTLYFAADSPEMTVAARLGSTLTGRYLFDVEQSIIADPDWASGVLKAVNHIQWGFGSEISFEEIGEEIQAFEEMWGEPPHLTVVDNAADVAEEGGDEFSALRATLKGLKYVARETNSALLVMHHTSEAAECRPCPPRWAIHGKVSQMPATILTIGFAQGSALPVAVVKNRQGPADVTGQTAVWLHWQPEVMSLNDMQER